MEQKKLNEIVQAHKLWLGGYSNGVRADLRDANLFDAYLSHANLRDANLSRADLSGADLSHANLSDANLSYANLSGADLSGTYLHDANLSHANLRDANLFDANLSDANLSGADLRGAYLSHANLRDANLSDANLSGADLHGTSRTTALHCPEEGMFTAWKKCEGDVIVKLLIPTEAKRSSATTNKCRAEFVKVIEVFGEEKAISNYDHKTEYIAGKTVRCDKWDENRWNECSGGIHFFLTRIEAEEY